LPLISGAAVGWSARTPDSGTAIIWFFLCAASAFLVHQPFQAWLGCSALRARSTEEKRLALAITLILLSFSGLCVIAVALHRRSLILLLPGLAGGCLFATMLMAGMKNRWLRAPSQIVGALGLTSTAMGAYYAITGTIDARAGLLWLGSWLFASAQIAYVQLRLRTASAISRREKLRAGRNVYLLHLALPLIATVATIAGAVSWLLALAFVPAAARPMVWLLSPPARVRVHRLGFTELAQNVVFAALLVAALLPR
jgi:heme/copper-type cytochrome/quinol oxidase subunit 3